MQQIIISSFFLLSFLCSASHYELSMQAQQYVQEKKYDKARTIYQTLIEYYPTNSTLHYNYAYLLKQLGYMHLAASQYQYVLARNPDHTHAHIGYAQALLALGDFTNGYAELEWRNLKLDPEIEKIKTAIATKARFDGYIFLLRAEWGIGDTIQMLRYAQELKKRGAIVHIALLHASLAPLCRMQSYIDHIILPGEYITPHHCAIPMISLPYVFGTQLDTILTPNQYLTLDTQHIKRWHTIMQSYRDTFNIGICWHGNTIHDAHKFMPLKNFASLSKIPNIRLFSLQKVHGLEEVQTVQHRHKIYFFEDFDETQGAFIDTAALMQHLDLVITVDTSVAHLAGALGIPTWLIIPKVADWRWMQERTNTPWYSSIRLFRQKEVDNWKMVKHEIKNALFSLLRTRNFT